MIHDMRFGCSSRRSVQNANSQEAMAAVLGLIFIAYGIVHSHNKPQALK